MSYKKLQYCRKFSLIFALLLLLQAAHPQYNFNKVDDWLAANLKDLGGRAVLVIYKDGKLIYNRVENDINGVTKSLPPTYGGPRTRRFQIKPFDSATQIMIASCSKWLSAALVMTFVDEGKLSLNDTIGKFLPVFTENGKGKITIWQCLSHLTGVAPGNFKESMQMIINAPGMDEAMNAIARQPMEGEPGKTFHYSNVGLQIAAAVIEKISNKNFETLFQERIAKPCGMVNSNFGKGKTVLAAGSARSTPKDYINFLIMILNEGTFNGQRVLTKNAVIEMQRNKVTKDTKVISSPAEAGNWGYGFGEWVMDLTPALSKGEGEMPTSSRSNAVTSPGLFGSFPWIDNEKKYAGLLFVFNIKNKGRNEKYKELKQLVDKAVTK